MGSPDIIQNRMPDCNSVFRGIDAWITVQTFNSCTSRPDVWQRLVVQTPMDNITKNKPSTLMTHVASTQRYVQLSSHSCIHVQETGLTIGRAVVYNARAAHTFSVGIKCRHCTSKLNDALVCKLHVWLMSLADIFDMPSMVVCTTIALADVRSTGAGIKCLYCR